MKTWILLPTWSQWCYYYLPTFKFCVIILTKFTIYFIPTSIMWISIWNALLFIKYLFTQRQASPVWQAKLYHMTIHQWFLLISTFMICGIVCNTIFLYLIIKQFMRSRRKTVKHVLPSAPKPLFPSSYPFALCPRLYDHGFHIIH